MQAVFDTHGESGLRQKRAGEWCGQALRTQRDVLIVGVGDTDTTDAISDVESNI